MEEAVTRASLTKTDYFEDFFSTESQVKQNQIELE